jgi:hypothetical protein
MQCPEEISAELIPQVVVILVLACSDDTVARAVHDDIQLAPVLQAFLQHVVDGLAYSYIAQQAKAAPILPLLHLLGRVLMSPSNSGTLITMGEDGAHK